MLSQIICRDYMSLKEALKIIDINGKGVCFVVNEKNLLVGILTDGDIRRALLSGGQFNSKVSIYMNRDFLSLNFDADTQLINQYLSKKGINIVPLVNKRGEVVDYADHENLHSIPVLSPNLNGNELKYLSECIRTNWISSQGKYVNKFEKIFSDMHPGYYSLAVSSGTTALHLTLVALGIKEGDEVIVPDITFAATINAVLYCQATPVICEINSKTWCIDIDSINELISPRTKAIIPVHLYGIPCEMEKLIHIAKDKDIFVIEDCAEAIGSKINKKRVGTYGDCSTFSFYGNKTITTGEGGMALFNCEKIYDKAKLLRDHGMSKNKRYWHDVVGFNYRMTNLQAAVGVAQMERFDQIIKSKQTIFDFYNKKFMGKKGILQLPINSPNITNSSWLYTLILDEYINRDSLINKLKDSGIDSRPSFNSLCDMPPYKGFTHSKVLKNSQLLSSQGISLPSSSSIKNIELEYIANIFLDEVASIQKNNINCKE